LEHVLCIDLCISIIKLFFLHEISQVGFSAPSSWLRGGVVLYFLVLARADQEVALWIRFLEGGKCLVVYFVAIPSRFVFDRVKHLRSLCT
jgi:hypothetical protein